METITQNTLPETGFVRLKQIIGDRKKGIKPIIPVSHTVWWERVKAGDYPPPVKLAPNVTAWPVSAIRELIDRLSTQPRAA